MTIDKELDRLDMFLNIGVISIIVLILSPFIIILSMNGPYILRLIGFMLITTSAVSSIIGLVMSSLYCSYIDSRIKNT